jgi:squalene-hopene/tetraprenyl-beta-curcumene cyclase
MKLGLNNQAEQRLPCPERPNRVATGPLKGHLMGTTLAFVLFCGTAAFAQNWNPTSAAAYLDQRSSWWMDWPKSARDHGTFCVSCHTATPYAISRAALRGPLGESGPSANEKRLLENVTKRVRMWKEVEPFYPDQTSGLPKTSESRGTEAVLNALILVSNNSPDAKLALDNLWPLQIKTGDMNGAWAWLQFHNAPWEGDSQFYGNALAAIAIGSAPGNYQAEPSLQDGIKRLNTYLQKNMAAQTPLDRAVLLWASAKLKGLLTPEQQKTIVDELLAKQCEDGGFTLSTVIGGWKRRDNTPIDPNSDGYATGLIAYALEQVDAPQAQVKRALAWLNKNQIKADGRWAASSLNKARTLESDAGLFMSDAATAYAVLALTNAH